MRARRAWALGVLLCVPGVPALADRLSAAGLPVGLPEAAEVLAASCYGCHSPAGPPDPALPDLSALDVQTFVQRMRAIRDGEMASAVMRRIARGYTDAEIDALARVMTASGGAPD